MRNTILTVMAPTLAALLVTSAFAAADPGLLPKVEEVVTADKDEKPQGWNPALSFGASMALSSNSNVVGQPDGSSWTFGLSLLGRLDFLSGVHDLRNSLRINEVFSRTPSIDEWIKTADAFVFETIYYINLTEHFGPFATFKLETALFSGFDVRPAPVTYVRADDTSVVVAADTTRLKLTSSFEPLVLKQAIGAFYRPINIKPVEVDIRAGFGAQQTFADGAFAVADVGSTPEIEVVRLTDFAQGGAVIGVEAKGEFEEGRVSYTARAEAMFPVINDDPQNRSVMDLANYDFNIRIAFKLFSFASLDYQFKAYRQPQLVDAWQVTNSLLLTFNYTLIGE